MSQCPCLHVHVSMSKSPCPCLHVHVSMSTSLCLHVPCLHSTMFPCLNVYVSMFLCLHLNVYGSLCLYVSMIRCLHLNVSRSTCIWSPCLNFSRICKLRTEQIKNGNFRLFAANGKQEEQSSVCLSKTEQKFVFLGRQTINSNRRLLFQHMCPSIAITLDYDFAFFH
jgi:hypothetical protein